MAKKMLAVRKVAPSKGLVVDEIPIPQVEDVEVLVCALASERDDLP